tara:strand:+ start:686 stop:889 length:204 start_codon:yes stop_codon:yes gene_type:complete
MNEMKLSDVYRRCLICDRDGDDPNSNIAFSNLFGEGLVCKACTQRKGWRKLIPEKRKQVLRKLGWDK